MKKIKKKLVRTFFSTRSKKVRSPTISSMPSLPPKQEPEVALSASAREADIPAAAADPPSKKETQTDPGCEKNVEDIMRLESEEDDSIASSLLSQPVEKDEDNSSTDYGFGMPSDKSKMTPKARKDRRSSLAVWNDNMGDRRRRHDSDTEQVTSPVRDGTAARTASDDDEDNEYESSVDDKEVGSPDMKFELRDDDHDGKHRSAQDDSFDDSFSSLDTWDPNGDHAATVESSKAAKQDAQRQSLSSDWASDESSLSLLDTDDSDYDTPLQPDGSGTTKIGRGTDLGEKRGIISTSAHAKNTNNPSSDGDEKSGEGENPTTANAGTLPYRDAAALEEMVQWLERFQIKHSATLDELHRGMKERDDTIRSLRSELSQRDALIHAVREEAARERSRLEEEHRRRMVEALITGTRKEEGRDGDRRRTGKEERIGGGGGKQEPPTTSAATLPAKRATIASTVPAANGRTDRKVGHDAAMGRRHTSPIGRKSSGGAAKRVSNIPQYRTTRRA